MSEAIDTAIKTILSGGATDTAPSRREFPRYSASYPVVVEFDGESREPISGTSVNLCRSGMLAAFDEPVPSGASVRVTFNSPERYEPELIECPCCSAQFPIVQLPEEAVHGTVVRVERQDSGSYVAAIMFQGILGTVDGGGD